MQAGIHREKKASNMRTPIILLCRQSAHMQIARRPVKNQDTFFHQLNLKKVVMYLDNIWLHSL